MTLSLPVFKIILLFVKMLFLRELNLTLAYKKMVNQQTHLSLPCTYGLAEHCRFNDLHDEIIRDCIFVGIRDTTLAQTHFAESR